MAGLPAGAAEPRVAARLSALLSSPTCGSDWTASRPRAAVFCHGGLSRTRGRQRTGSGPDVTVPPPVTYTSFTGRTWTYGEDTTGFREPDKRGNSWIRANRVQVQRADYNTAPERINEGSISPTTRSAPPS